MFRRALLSTPRLATPAPVSFTTRNITTSFTPRIAPLARRAYSTEPGKENGDKAAEPAKPTTQPPKDEGEPLADALKKYEAELEAKAKEAADLKDKFLRTVADFRNLQDRTAREIKAAKDFAIQRFAKDLIESVDHIDLALAAVPEVSRASTAAEKKDLVDLYNGLKVTESALLKTLQKHGLEKINPLGEKFDPNVHEATFQAKVEGKEAGTVFHVQRTGFKLNGRTLRAAQVGVVQA